jgi:GTP-binding protein
VQADDKMTLPPHRAWSLEEAIGYVAPDELIEVTPAAVRLRKAVLDASARKVAAKRAAAVAAAEAA